jgi:hypothetical protein
MPRMRIRSRRPCSRRRGRASRRSQGTVEQFRAALGEPNNANAPGPDDDKHHDIVVMDDFLYGEPQPLP